MSDLFFTLPGRPVPWARAGSRSGRRFTRPEVKAYQEQIAWAAKAAGATIMEGGLVIDINAFWPAPQRKQNLMGRFRPSIPDIDNITKTVLDALNGIAWKDDAQIVVLHVTKKYGTPRLDVMVRRIEC